MKGVCGVILRDAKPFSHEFRKESTDNSEQLSRQACSGIETAQLEGHSVMEALC